MMMRIDDAYLGSWEVSQWRDVEGVDEQPVHGGEKYWQTEDEGESHGRV